MDVKRVQATVTGQVQGVGYRYFAVHAAQRLGLAGTVRNVAGGDVEVLAEGDEALMREFVDELRRGPSTARVTELREAWSEPDSESQSDAGFNGESNRLPSPFSAVS